MRRRAGDEKRFSHIGRRSFARPLRPRPSSDKFAKTPQSPRFRRFASESSRSERSHAPGAGRMAPSTALHHVSQVLTCLMFQHAHFEENIAPPKLVPAVPHSGGCLGARSPSVRGGGGERAREARAGGSRPSRTAREARGATWRDCLVSAIDALLEDATSARRRCEAFANQVLNDAVRSAEDGDVGNNRLQLARVESRHARLLMDQGSHETVAMLVAAGYVEPAATALLEVLRTTEVWEMRRNLTLERAAEWKGAETGLPSPAGSRRASRRWPWCVFVLDEMTASRRRTARRGALWR